AQLERVEAVLRHDGRAALERGAALVPRGTGVGLVEAEHVPELLPELLVGLVRGQVGKDERGPRRVWARHDRPVDQLLADDAAPPTWPRWTVAPWTASSASTRERSAATAGDRSASANRDG